MSEMIALQNLELLLRLRPEEAQLLLETLRWAHEPELEYKIARQLEEQHYFKEQPIPYMSYSGFTDLGMIKNILADTDAEAAPLVTSVVKENLFSETPRLNPSEWLQTTLAMGQEAVTESEKGRSESMIYPVLLEILHRNPKRFTLFSGQRFDVDVSRGLVGECDFLLSYSLEKPLIEAPVFALVEAKRRTVEEGLAQCAAQMIAAQEFNKKRNQALSQIFGCVSDGESWRFLKLAQNTLHIAQEKYFLKLELEKILGVFQEILAGYQ